jgi:hypothetical protein
MAKWSRVLTLALNSGVILRSRFTATFYEEYVERTYEIKPILECLVRHYRSVNLC